MQLTFKTLQQQTFTLEAEPTQKVSDLKAKIEQLQQHPIAAQKLILKGKILADEVTVQDLGAGEKDFIVLMVTKPKTASTAPSPAVAQPQVQTPTPAPAQTTPAPVPAQTTPASQPAGAFDASTLATGNAFNTAVENMVEMGFPRDQVLAAMKAAFNNPDRAVEYLMTGIPESAASAPAPAQQQPTTAATPIPAQPAQQGEFGNLFQQAAQQVAQQQQTPQPTGPLNPDLEALRNSPQFIQFRQLVQAQPHLLPQLLQQIGQTNPQILEMISQNQDQFMQMLTEGVDDYGEANTEQIVITPEENEAINRLVSLGFDRNLAVEAYLACDKNEEMAANYLFDMGGDYQ